MYAYVGRQGVLNCVQSSYAILIEGGAVALGLRIAPRKPGANPRDPLAGGRSSRGRLRAQAPGRKAGWGGGCKRAVRVMGR